MNDARVDELERQIERNAFFTHTALSGNSDRMDEIEGFIYGLIDVLLDKKAISTEELGAARDKVQEELVERGERPALQISLRFDGQDDNDDVVGVDCAARMPVCQAICCKLQFALSPPEVESGKIKWDLGRPYLIRHSPDGFCCHNDRGTGECGIYEDRPRVCATYSCAGDERIWKDFDRMILNQEWLDAHLAESSPRLRSAMMREVPVHLGRTRVASLGES